MLSEFHVMTGVRIVDENIINMVFTTCMKNPVGTIPFEQFG